MKQSKSEPLSDGWLIYKSGQGWYRQDAQGYTNDPSQAGRFDLHRAIILSHPNGFPNGSRDGMSMHHETAVPGATTGQTKDTELTWIENNFPHELRELLLQIGKVEWGTTPEHDAGGHGEHIRESVEKTAEHFGQTGPQKMHGLYLEGTSTVLCHTGTSPNSPDIARVLTGAWNWLWEIAKASDRGKDK